jgi:cyclophilin family peptidyl-prolyl cis-trans isomerase
MTDATAKSATPVPTIGALEMWWDKNRTIVFGCLVALALALGCNYAWQYWVQSKRDALWTGAAQAIGLRPGYAEDGSAIMMARDPNWIRFDGVRSYVHLTQRDLVTRLQEHMKGTALEAIDRELAASRGTPTEPFLLWAKACKQFSMESWDGADAVLRELEERFPNHLLTQKSAYPVQYRAQLDEPPEKPDPRYKPKLADTVTGASIVSMMRARIVDERAWRDQNIALFKAPEPDTDSATVRFETTQGVFKIRFFKSKAPKHVESFLGKVEANFYDKQKIDRVLRQGEQQSNAFQQDTRPSEFHLGLEVTKTEENREKWSQSEPSTTKLDWEENDLSHFPFMVAAAPESGGKSSGERIWINATDAAKTWDKQRVIFGVVTEGKDVIERICAADLSSVDENRSGSGRPRDNITIEKVVIE